MTELERRKERIEKLKNYRIKRIEIARSIILYCQNFIYAEEQLMKVTDKEQRKIMHDTKRSAKYALLIRFEQFKKMFKE